MADGEKEVASQKTAKIIAKVIGGIVGLCILVIVAFIVYGQFAQPGSAWDQWPPQREPLLRQFLGHINAGTEKDYAAAYKLISQRETGVTNAMEGAIVANMHRLRDELIKNNGADWHSKMNITIPPYHPILGDEVLAEIRIGKNLYHIGFQAQMSELVAVKERRIKPKDRQPHREDGKVRWGIGEVVEIPLTEGRKEYRPGCDVADDDAPGPIPGF